MADEPIFSEDAEEETPVVPNAADRGHQRRVRDAAKREEIESATFWEALFKTERGRREMWDILEVSGFFRDAFSTSGTYAMPNHDATMFQHGRAALGRNLFLSWLRRSPEGVLLMLRENHHDLRPSK